MRDMKEVLAATREESKQLTDNLDRKDVTQVALLGLSKKDMENLKTIRAAEPRTKNYAVLIRRAIAKAAKEAQEKDKIVKLEGQTSIDDFL